MEYISKTVTLKNGKACLIRRGEERDAELLIEHWRATAVETRNLTREPGEDGMTVEEQRALIREKNAEENVLNLLAFVDGQHAGNCAFNPVEDGLRMRHRCAVGIVLYRKFWGMRSWRRCPPTLRRSGSTKSWALKKRGPRPGH